MLRNLVVLLLSCACALAQTAGKVDKLVPAGYLTHEKATSEAKAADPVAWNDVARTNDQGRMRIALTDGSLLTLGSKAEMRVVKHDTTSQQTVVELLYGAMRTKVAPLTKPDSSFQVHTPTAVIGAIGTEAAIVTHEVSSTVTNISKEQLENLPSPRSFQSLADLVPGAAPGSGPSIADYSGVDSTDVYSLDHVVGVRNIDPAVKGTVYVSPGQMTTVHRGQPPTPPVPFTGAHLFTSEDETDRRYPPRQGYRSWRSIMDDLDRNCGSEFVMDGKVISSSDPNRIGQPVGYNIFGRGTGSTGNVLRAQFINPTQCEMHVLLHAGSVLEPFQFTGGIKGLTHSNYQIMLTFGGFWTIPPMPMPPPPGAFYFLPPETSNHEVVLQAYCLERTKLAPHPGTAYRVGEPALQDKFSAYQRFVDKAHELFLKGEMQPTAPLDLVIQWAIWIDQEKMSEKAFREAHTKLVEKVLEEQHRKFDKEMKARVEAAQNDIWPNAQKLIGASR